MNITVFGNGVRGLRHGGVLGRDGRSVTGVDLQQIKVSLINWERSVIIEPGLQGLIRQVFREDGCKRFGRATA